MDELRPVDPPMDVQTANAPGANAPLLWKVYDHIKAHPKEWNQLDWAIRRQTQEEVCGTAYCFAGHAVVMAGHQIDWERADEFRSGDITAHLTDGQRIEDVAMYELGLSELQGCDLFSAVNSLEDIHRNLVSLTGEDRPL